ncbi:hypothetical protein [Calothrix sp. NIES-3974]|uniref:hypothetical protein n=1 Tax=Calothrix sp. NIES-3974 TaxID=2005462 RepID=UPI000B6213B4|nr:hypothetical protein [Calothrix sp. NIES-3974]BAZ04727.1 hypothetical protein NIES3974_13700 [Calothrix sp. NIES-3974]
MKTLQPGLITLSAIAGLFTLSPASAQTTIIIEHGGYTQTIPTDTKSSVIYYNSHPSIQFRSTTVSSPNYAGGSIRHFYSYPHVNHPIHQPYRRVERSQFTRTRPVFIYPHSRNSTVIIKPILTNDSWHHRVPFRSNSRVIIVPR